MASFVVVLLLGGSAYAALPVVRRGAHRAAREIGHWFVKRQLILLQDVVRLIRTDGTIVVQADDEAVRVRAKALAPNLQGKQVFTLWQKYAVVPPTLIHRPTEDVHVGEEWIIPTYVIDEEGIVLIVMLADARDVHDPARVVRDEDVQVGYLGLRWREGRVEVFDPDSLVPPPRPRKDRRWLPALDLAIPAK